MKRLAFLPLLLVLAGCPTMEQPETSPVYELGKIGFHIGVRAKAADLMARYLDRHPDSAERLPLLNLAWTHFWEGGAPFSRQDFDAWLADQMEGLEATDYERASLLAAADLLWAHLEESPQGFVKVDDRSRRIVDSLVAGFRLGYRQWVASR